MPMSPRSVRIATLAPSLSLVLALTCPSLALAEGSSIARTVNAKADSSRDGVYDRFDGDLELALALGAELGTAGGVAPAVRGSAHYFSIAGLYAGGRVHPGGGGAPSLFDLGIDVRPLFVPRWAKGYESGPALFDLTLDSVSLSLGGFWTRKLGAPRPGPGPARGFEAALGFGVPLLARAAGPWLEARGMLRYPDSGEREEALLVALAWHGFLLTPLISSQAE